MCVAIHLVLCAIHDVPYPSAAACQCPIFRRVAHCVCGVRLVRNCVLVLVRMSHPSAATCQCPIFCRVAHCVCGVRLVCNCVLVLVRMSHPSAAACQDVPSFVGWPIVCVMYVLCVIGSLC